MTDDEIMKPKLKKPKGLKKFDTKLEEVESVA